MKSLLKTIEILNLLKNNSHKYSIAEISSLTEMPPSTVHRILQTLCDSRFVSWDPLSHMYELGPALIPLGNAAAQNIHLQDAARPVLRKLSGSVYEDSFLIVKVGDSGMVVQQQHRNINHMRVVEDFGYELDLHCGAIRKVLLAYQSPEYIRYYLNTCLERPKAFPITSRHALEKELTHIRHCGYSVSHGEYIHDAAGIGAPVFDSSNNITASLGIILPFSRIHDEKRLDFLKKEVVHAAAELSESLGSNVTLPPLS